MAVAVVAVLIALGAPSYAAQVVRSVLFAKKAGNAQRVDGLRAFKKPHPNALLALDSRGRFPASVSPAGTTGAQGPRGLTGPQGAQGLQGPKGDRGFPGSPGSALADSVIVFEPPDEGGQAVWRIDDSLSKGLDNDVNFTWPAGTHGVFCLHDLSFTVKNAVATPGPFGSAPFFVQVDVARPGHAVDASCPAGSAAAIYVTDSTGAREDPPDPTDTIYFELN
jgi:hypothetical protein